MNRTKLAFVFVVVAAAGVAVKLAREPSATRPVLLGARTEGFAEHGYARARTAFDRCGLDHQDPVVLLSAATTGVIDTGTAAAVAATREARAHLDQGARCASCAWSPPGRYDGLRPDGYAYATLGLLHLVDARQDDAAALARGLAVLRFAHDIALAGLEHHPVASQLALAALDSLEGLLARRPAVASELAAALERARDLNLAGDALASERAYALRRASAGSGPALVDLARRLEALYAEAERVARDACAPRGLASPVAGAVASEHDLRAECVAAIASSDRVVARTKRLVEEARKR